MVTPLHQAAYHGQHHVCRFLIDQGADVDPISVWGTTPLMWAANAGHVEVMALLTESGANPALVDEKGSSSLFHALHGRQTPALHWLLAKFPNCSVHTVDNEGHNLFQWAAYTGNLGAMRYLKEVHKADLQVTDKEGRTSLHWACRQGHADAVVYLLKQDVSWSLTHRDKDGLTPAEAAAAKGFRHVAGLVEDAQNNGLTAASSEGCTARSESTVSVCWGNPAQFRKAVYGLSCFSMYFLVLSKLLPALIGVLVVPIVVILPPALDGVIFRRGQPPVRSIQILDEGSGCFGIRSTAAALALGAERNLCVLVSIALFQVLVPHLFLSSPAGAFLAAQAPAVHGGFVVCAALAFLFFVATSARRPDSPKLNNPRPTQESSSEEGGLVSVIPLTPGTFCFETMEKRSLRSAHCDLIGRVVAGFDHFNVTADVAVGLGNRGMFILWNLFLCAWTLIVAVSTVLWGIYRVSPPDASYSVCRCLGRIIVSGFPGGDPSPSYISENQYYAMWLLFAPAFMCLLAGERVFLQVTLIASGLTREESNKQFT
eukprot:gene21142-32570_t